jgi:transcription-repair coupling factor (superfamily II helicase)
MSPEAKERVETLVRHTELGSGFSIATTDMEIRGAGNLLGPEQSGNVSAVGFEMFCDLLKEATETLSGKVPRREVEPELTFEQPGLIPEEYIEDVGQRLHFYKRLASAEDEQEIERIAAELVDRFGTIPRETEDLIDVMKVKALSRMLGIRGVEVTSQRMTIHLAEDSRVDPAAVVRVVQEEKGRVQLTEDLKIRMGLLPSGSQATITAIQFLQRLMAYGNNPSIL